MIYKIGCAQGGVIPSLLRRMRRGVSLALRSPIAGPIFRLYAPRRRWDGAGAREKSNGCPEKTRVLVVNLMTSLGDAVCYMALADTLAAIGPKIDTTWLVSGSVGDLYKMHPGIDRVLSIEANESWLLRTPTMKSYYKLWRTMRSVMALPIDKPFDVCLLPRGGVDPSFSAHAMWMLNVARSYGYSRRVEPDEVDHNYSDCLLSHIEEHISASHESMRPVALLRSSGLISDNEARWNEGMPIAGMERIALRHEADRLLRRVGLARNIKFVVVSPGAGLKKKMWPSAKFRDLCRRIVDHTGHRVLVSGGSGEAELCNAVANGLGPAVRSCAGVFELAELITVLSRARMFIGNDSGAGHVAGALGIPAVSLHVQPKTGDPSHISAPEHYMPVGPRVIVVRPNDFLSPCRGRCESGEVHCLDQVTVDQVWVAVRRILDDLGDQRRQRAV